MKKEKKERVEEKAENVHEITMSTCQKEIGKIFHHDNLENSSVPGARQFGLVCLPGCSSRHQQP